MTIKKIDEQIYERKTLIQRARKKLKRLIATLSTVDGTHMQTAENLPKVLNFLGQKTLYKKLYANIKNKI